MKLERSNIKFPLWRKKVDDSLLEDGITPIPQFLWDQWGIVELFSSINSKKDPKSFISIRLGNKTYVGNIAFTKNNKCRLFLELDLVNQLKETYLMSYMRSIEGRLRKSNPKYKNKKIEEEISFWEFIDLEFDVENKVLICTPHYVQIPLFRELFSEIVNSHILFDIENRLTSRNGIRISKHDWRSKEKLKSQIDVKNVIYNLIDVVNQEVYIGEAESLTQRVTEKRDEIPGWTHYRFDSLPNDLTKDQRLAIERLIIRTFASFLPNSKGINSKEISEFKLVNKKIDS